MTESTSPQEGQQQPLPTRAQMFQLERSLREQILDKAESDPEFRQLLIDDPELAMRELIQQQQGEVVGQVWAVPLTKGIPGINEAGRDPLTGEPWWRTKTPSMHHYYY